MTEDKRFEMAGKIAQRNTNDTEIGDLIEYYYENQFTYYYNLSDEDLIEEYRMLDN